MSDGRYDQMWAEAVAREVLAVLAGKPEEGVVALIKRVREWGMPWEAVEEFCLSLHPHLTAKDLAQLLDLVAELQEEEEGK